MNNNKTFCFRHSDGEDIYLFTLRNHRGTEVAITNYGAIITALKIKMPDGSFNDLVLGFDKVQDYLSDSYLSQYCYLGAACGRYANRIKNGMFLLDGKEYHLSKNMGPDILHGGFHGFDKKTWFVKKFSETTLQLSYTSADGEEGFPGKLETHLDFSLTDHNELTYEFTATSDKPTAINLTHHSYFNLNNGSGTIEDHEVKIYSSRILAQDEGLVCNGEYIPVAGTLYDFRDFKKINKEWDKNNGYDQCFEIDHKTDKLESVAEARSLKSGIRIQIFSTDPAVQFYTAQGMGKLSGKNGEVYGPFSGLCLETHKHPNAINIPHFPNTVLRPGEKYYQKNSYRIFQEAK
jgi:aldose 1-epimerase